jgi:hypothetical protein
MLRRGLIEGLIARGEGLGLFRTARLSGARLPHRVRVGPARLSPQEEAFLRRRDRPVAERVIHEGADEGDHARVIAPRLSQLAHPPHAQRLLALEECLVCEPRVLDYPCCPVGAMVARKLCLGIIRTPAHATVLGLLQNAG